MSEGGSRRAVAEIRFGEDRIGITKVGGRSIHQYWSLLGPHFRDVLLAPQRRSDDGGVAWTWREASDKKPLTASEFASVRKRLERANESFAENPVNPLMGEARTGTSSQALIDQVAAKVKAMAQSLSAKSDAALADFVCRTETGVMVHSWGVASVAQIIYPDSLETGVSGVVLIGGKPSEGHEVVIENAKGLSVARMMSDDSGEFHFSKINPGRYRVRVVSGRVKFPAKGVMVAVERGAVSRLELPSTADSNDQGESATNSPMPSSTETSPGSLGSTPPQEKGGRGWFGKTVGVLLLLMLLVGGGVWAWLKWSTSSETDQRVAVRSSSMAPEAYNAGGNEAHAVEPSSLPVGDGALGASADGIGSGTHRPVLRSSTTTSRGIPAAMTTGVSPSTIGSKVDVLSGVAGTRGSAEKSAVEPAVSSATSSETAGLESVSDQASTISDTGATTGTTADAGKKRPGVIMAGAPVSVPKQKGGGVGAGEIEAIAGDKTKPLPGGNSADVTGTAPAVKKQTKAKDAAAAGKPSAAGAAPQDGIVTPGAARAESSPDDGAADKAGDGLPQAKGPTSKVSVVNIGPPKEKPLPASGALSGDDAAAAEDKDSPAPEGPKRKREKNTPVTKAKAPTGGVAAADAESPDSPPEQNDVVTQAPADNSQAAESLNSSSGNNGRATANSQPQSSVSASAASKAEGLKPEAVKAAALQASPKRPVGTSVTKPTEKTRKPKQLEDQESKSNSPEETSETERAPSANFVAGGGAVANAQVAELRGTRWESRLLRDVIVPTLPVCVGKDDPADQVRDKMFSAQKAREPVVFKHPVTLRGFIFELVDAPTARAFNWQDSPENAVIKKTAVGSRAEIIWSGEVLPRGSAQVLLFSDGREAARLTVSEKGGLVLKVAKGVRSNLSLMIKRSMADESGLTKSDGSSRFGWQVNGVLLNSAQQTEKPAAVNRDERINVPLDLAKGGRIEVALADRVTSWALVTNIQLQPAP